MSFIQIKNQKSKIKNGFTLIELLVAIAIIGILTAVGVSSFVASRRNARDSKRVADARTVQTQAEQYLNDTGAYPATLAVMAPTYFEKAPVDPQSTPVECRYVYAPTATGYTFTYVLERVSSDAPGLVVGMPVGCARAQAYTVTRENE